MIVEMDALIEQAKTLAPASDRDFVKLGRVLGELQAVTETLDEFQVMLGEIGIGYRKARYLIRLAEVVAELGLDEEKLVQIGWTKATMLAPVMGPRNADWLIKMAGTMTAVELKALLEGESEELQTVTFYVSKAQKETLMNALGRRGARSSGRHVVGKTAALMRVIEEADKVVA